MALQFFFGPLAVFSFSCSYRQSVRIIGQEINQLQGPYLRTGHHKHKLNTQTSMPRVGFEPTTAAFEWTKAVLALDRSDTLIPLLN